MQAITRPPDLDLQGRPVDLDMEGKPIVQSQTNIPVTELNVIPPTEEKVIPTPKPESKGLFSPRPLGGYGFLADVGNKVLDIGKSFINSSPAMEFARSTHAPPLNEEDLEQGRNEFMNNSGFLSSVGRAANSIFNPMGGVDPTGPDTPTFGESFDATLPIRPLVRDVSEGNYVGAGLDLGFGALNLLGMHSGLMGRGEVPLQEPILKKPVPKGPKVLDTLSGETTDVRGNPIRAPRVPAREDIPSNILPNTGAPITQAELESMRLGKTKDRRATVRTSLPNPPKTYDELVKRVKNEVGLDLSGVPQDEALLKLNDLVRENKVKYGPVRDALYDVLRAGKEPFKSEVQSGNVPNTPKKDIGVRFLNNPTSSNLKRMRNLGYEPTGRILPDGSVELARKPPSGNQGGGNLPPNEPPSTGGNPPNEPPNPPQDTVIVHPERIPEGIEKEGLYRKVSGTIRSTLTSWDLSALRQAKGLILHPEYWKNLGTLIKSWGSQRISDEVKRSIIEKPSGYFRPGETGKSFAEEAGLDLSKGSVNERFRSRIAEKWIPGVKQSARSFDTYITKLRADVFDKLYGRAVSEGRGGLETAKQIADSINVSTGTTSFGNLERSKLAMTLLNETFFAPKYNASRVRMYTRVLNPKTYYAVDPIVRREALKSLLGVVGSGLLVGELGRLAGAEVSNDPTNPDFRKIKIGNIRIDNFAGLQQYGVAASKFLSGESTSSQTGRSADLTNPRFGGDTRGDVVSRFMTSKLAPIPSFVWAWMNTKEFDGTPFEAKQALVNRTVPILMQDLYSIYQEDPSLLPLGFLAMFGEGMQTYGR